MQMPCLASSLQQWHYPPSLSILGSENLGAVEEKAVGFGNCHRACARFRLVVPGAGTAALHVPRRKTSVLPVFGVRCQVICCLGD